MLNITHHSCEGFSVSFLVSFLALVGATPATTFAAATAATSTTASTTRWRASKGFGLRYRLSGRANERLGSEITQFVDDL